MEDKLTIEIYNHARVIFERRFGRTYTIEEFEKLSRTEQDWVLTEAGKEVNKMRIRREIR